MRYGILKRIIIIIILLFTVLYTNNYLKHFNKEKIDFESDLYLPEAEYLKFISLGFDGLISDLILAKGLTYYGSHYFQRKIFKFKHLKKIFFTAVELDHNNKDAFLMGNNVLKTVDLSSKSSIELLKRGMFYHPTYWKFPEMIGFNYYYNLDDPENAGKYYEIASRIEGKQSKTKGPAPYVASLSGKFYEESGKYREALRVLKKFYENTKDKRLKKSFLESYRGVLKRIYIRDEYVKRHLKIIEKFIKIQSGTF